MKYPIVLLAGVVWLLSACSRDGTGAHDVADGTGEPRGNCIVSMNNFFGFPMYNYADFCDKDGRYDSVYFAPGSVALSDEAKRILDRQLAGLLHLQDSYRTAARPPPFLVTVEGHTDIREANSRHGSLELGERRAAVVRAYFISKGMSAKYIRTISYGREKPIAVGSDEASLAQNRRTSSYHY